MTPEALKAVREALNKIVGRYESQAKFADPEPASYFREFVAVLKEPIALLAAEQAKAPPDRERLAKVAENAAEWFRTNAIHSDYIAPLWEAAALLRRLSPVTAGEWQPIETTIKRLRAEMDDIDRFITPLSEADPTNPNGDKCLPAYRFSSGAWMMLRARILHVLEALPPSPKEAGR